MANTLKETLEKLRTYKPEELDQEYRPIAMVDIPDGQAFGLFVGGDLKAKIWVYNDENGDTKVGSELNPEYTIPMYETYHNTKIK